MEKKLREELNNILDLNMKTTLVLSSGGSKGICHIGAIRALEEKNIMQNITTIVGCSAGSFIGALLAIKYTASEMKEILMQVDMSKFFTFDIINFFKNYGLDNGHNINIILSKLFENKGFDKNTTFSEIYKRTNIKLIITCTCINTNEAEYMSVDTTPNLEVITAIRMSSAIPILCSPIKYNDKLYIDGACVTNYPIHLFKDELDKVIGIFLLDEKSNCTINNIEDYIINTIKIMFDSYCSNSYKGYEKNTIKINVKCDFLNYDHNKKSKQKLFNIGYTIAKEYLLGL